MADEEGVTRGQVPRRKPVPSPGVHIGSVHGHIQSPTRGQVPRRKPVPNLGVQTGSVNDHVNSPTRGQVPRRKPVASPDVHVGSALGQVQSHVRNRHGPPVPLKDFSPYRPATSVRDDPEVPVVMPKPRDSLLYYHSRTHQATTRTNSTGDLVSSNDPTSVGYVSQNDLSYRPSTADAADRRVQVRHTSITGSFTSATNKLSRVVRKVGHAVKVKVKQASISSARLMKEECEKAQREVLENPRARAAYNEKRDWELERELRPGWNQTYQQSVDDATQEHRQFEKRLHASFAKQKVARHQMAVDAARATGEVTPPQSPESNPSSANSWFAGRRCSNASEMHMLADAYAEALESRKIKFPRGDGDAKPNPVTAAAKRLRNAAAEALELRSPNDSIFGGFSDQAPAGAMEPCSRCGREGLPLTHGRCRHCKNPDFKPTLSTVISEPEITIAKNSPFSSTVSSVDTIHSLNIVKKPRPFPSSSKNTYPTIDELISTDAQPRIPGMSSSVYSRATDEDDFDVNIPSAIGKLISGDRQPKVPGLSSSVYSREVDEDDFDANMPSAIGNLISRDRQSKVLGLSSSIYSREIDEDDFDVNKPSAIGKLISRDRQPKMLGLSSSVYSREVDDDKPSPIARLVAIDRKNQNLLPISSSSVYSRGVDGMSIISHSPPRRPISPLFHPSNRPPPSRTPHSTMEESSSSASEGHRIGDIVSRGDHFYKVIDVSACDCGDDGCKHQRN